LIQITALAAGVLLASAFFYGQAGPLQDEVTREALRFTQVYTAVKENFVELVDPDRAIFDGGIRGLLAALDPFSAFFDRDQFAMLQQQVRGEARGFGSILYVQPGKILILQTREGSPSWRAGLGPGDEIVEVNGQRVNRLDLKSLIELLQQARSEPVRLGVIRPGKVVAEDFELNPVNVPLPSVDKAFLLSPTILYVHLASFEQKTPPELVEVVNRLGGNRLRGLLLDLRDNRGGVVEAAVRVASLFLRPDQPVLTLRGRTVPEKTFRTLPTDSRFDLPLVVLVNGNTASAAEVVAAAMQEHDRAVIAGEATFGKGVIETVMPLSEQTGLALTTAQYFTASGRSLQRALPGTAFDLADGSAGTHTGGSASFKTRNGRPLAAGGGVQPDVEIPSRTLNPWLVFLNQRGAFTDFAQEYLASRGRVEPSFEPDAKVLEEFRQFLHRSRIRTPEPYWKESQPYLALRVKTEIFALVFGLARAEEVETRADPQVQQAARLFSKIPQLLRPHPRSTDARGATK